VIAAATIWRQYATLNASLVGTINDVKAAVNNVDSTCMIRGYLLYRTQLTSLTYVAGNPSGSKSVVLLP
jgi:hypothetical protein